MAMHVRRCYNSNQSSFVLCTCRVDKHINMCEHVCMFMCMYMHCMKSNTHVHGQACICMYMYVLCVTQFVSVHNEH